MPSKLIPGALSLYSEEPKLTLFESGDLSANSVVIYTGGLTDGYMSVPYLHLLSEKLGEMGWSLAQVTLSSSYNQYGLASLEGDAREIALAVEYLRRERGRGRVVLMGHSTGCQDAIHYLTKKPWNTSTGSDSPRPPITAAILQAPVCDREYFEATCSVDAIAWVEVAKGLVEEGKGSSWMPKAASDAAMGKSGFEGEAEEIGEWQAGSVPFTAYRFWSLYAEGGDDDYFHSSLTMNSDYFAASPVPLLLLLSGEDEYYPPYLSDYDSKEALLSRWRDASEGKISQLSEVLRGASHSISQEDAQERMVGVVKAFLQRLDQEP
ncbi:hypothetical protein BOTBODRAFT_30956 [Botryobasidium botryosum FD-172 SS1]|uniref:DUF1749-domain-containing protein n=1 Tax=Botryobasidium botryosum (strain FD-172 SS1) TaxID=930990 RepID=A0A067MXG0_BOTB1|nr:hypothetical protein BOTBODRAFT_30956 [Botryobasidium botryosum FD-172 SS1]